MASEYILLENEDIDQMVAVYRELNMTIRSRDLRTADSVKNEAGETLDSILRNMRNREYNSSQAFKQMILLGQPSDHIDETAPAGVMDELVLSGMNPAIMLSQFGTAREASLSILRGLPEERWVETFKTPRGEITVRDYVQSLLKDDREDQKKIEALAAKLPANS